MLEYKLKIEELNEGYGWGGKMQVERDVQSAVLYVKP